MALGIKTEISKPKILSTDQMTSWEAGGEDVEVSLASGAVAKRQLLAGVTLGPFLGALKEKKKHSGDMSDGDGMVLTHLSRACWLQHLSLGHMDDNNCIVFAKEDQLWCKVTHTVEEGESLRGILHNAKNNLQEHLGDLQPNSSTYPQSLHRNPAQPASMTTCKPSFPCKNCNISFSSEKNLQAHLTFYCAGRFEAPASMVYDGPQCKRANARDCDPPNTLGDNTAPFVNGVAVDHTYPMSPVGCFPLGICDSRQGELKIHSNPSSMNLSSATLPETSDFTVAHGNSTKQSFRCKKENGHCIIDGPHGLKQTAPHENYLQEQCSVGLASMDTRDCGRDKIKEETDARWDEAAKVCEKQVTLEKDLGSNDKSEQVQPQEDTSSERFHVTKNIVKVKSEPRSPEPLPCPVQHAKSTGMDASFLSDPILGHSLLSYTPVGVNKSDWLAKMANFSSLHVRPDYTAVRSSSLQLQEAHRKTTCFECNISFTKLETYLAHKQLYCAGGRLLEGTSQDIAVKTKSLECKLGIEVKNHAVNNKVNNVPLPKDTATKTLGFCVQDIKKETVENVGNEISNEDFERNGAKPTQYIQNDGQTTCETCSIHFSRVENYNIHKQFYCATRHNPSGQRQTPGAQDHTSRPKPQVGWWQTRLRKRGVQNDPTSPKSSSSSDSEESRSRSVKKRCEQPATSRLEVKVAGEVGTLPFGAAGKDDDAKDPLLGGSPSGAVSCPDAPIDLSLRTAGQVLRVSPGLSVSTCFPSIQESPQHLLFSDYHKCASCQIAFGKLENYLAHKRYYCAGASLASSHCHAFFQPGLGQRTRLNGALAYKQQKNPAQPISNAKNYVPQNAVCTPTPCARQRFVEQQYCNPNLATETISPLPASSPNISTSSIKRQCEIDDESSGALSSVVCPEGLIKQEEIARDEENGKVSSNTDLQSSPNASPAAPENVDKRPQSSCSDTSLCTTSAAVERPSSAGSTDSGTRSRINVTGQGGAAGTPVSSKYCRLCDIQFSSLSNFVAHKKFYCASHTNEHHAVK
uniref:zinc finger protein ZFPM2-like isoform X2 n=1 Tax=Myxine glutinosa TaxID=7769 RepID=UPI00358F00FE